jgi:hypothetical protein
MMSSIPRSDILTLAKIGDSGDRRSPSSSIFHTRGGVSKSVLWLVRLGTSSLTLEAKRGCERKRDAE